jgi:hypothetical protein
MAEQSITVEIEGDYTFELEPTGDRDLATEARAVFDKLCVVETREDGSFTVHPVSRVTAVHVGTVPERRIGFPTIPSP